VDAQTESHVRTARPARRRAAVAAPRWSIDFEPRRARMSSYTFRDVERLLGLPRPVVQGFVEAGFVVPSRGERNELRFSFQDLILLRTAQGLATVKVPPRRIKQALARLRAELPESVPLSGVRIAAVGSRVVVQQGTSQWQADSGQYLLDLDASPASEPDAPSPQPHALPYLRPLAPSDDSAEHWFARAGEWEATDPKGAETAYRNAIDRKPDFLAAYVNLGCMLQARGDAGPAERAYRAAIARLPDEPLLHFNLGTALEDLRRPDEAAQAYQAAIALDPTFADAYFNLARLCEAQGHAQEAIRHLAAYRRLMRKASGAGPD
jgi:tetratricopeptide (TPR) repeat protein